jgi:hypothetical protein
VQAYCIIWKVEHRYIAHQKQHLCINKKLASELREVGILVSLGGTGMVAIGMWCHGGHSVKEGAKVIVWADILPNNGPVENFSI